MAALDHFSILARDPQSDARVAKIHTAHGEILTPTFMPVATRASVKALAPDELETAGAQILIANAFHLYLSPGAELVKEAGGIAAFMGWDGPTITDSGGYQVSYMWQGGKRTREDLPSEKNENGSDDSRANTVRIDDKGAMLVSHHNQAEHVFTPESSIEVQSMLGADIVMAFDQPTLDGASRAEAEVSTRRSILWAQRSRDAWLELQAQKRNPHQQLLFGIIQGGRHEDLRQESARAIVGLDLPGIAVGGETIGIDPQVTVSALDMIRDLVPRDRPYYAMGLGGLPEGFFVAVERGVDLFDNSSVTRMARTGLVFISPQNGGKRSNRFRLDISKAIFRNDFSAIDPGCDCYACTRFSRAYLHHLFKNKDLLAYRLASLHNVRSILRLGEEIRTSIREGTYQRLRAQWLRD